MEDINFKKFICYILNCIGAAESNDANKRNILYINDELKKVSYDGTKSRINFKKLDYAYKDIGGIPVNAALVLDLDAGDVDEPYTILNNNINNIKQYFNVKQLPKYIVLDDDDPKQLNVARSIHQAFDLINVSFDAKNWYLKQYRDLQNPISRSGIIFNSDNKRKFYGGTKIEYKDNNKEVNDITYDQLLSNVLKDIIYMITDETEKIKDFDVITLYILSKINYYLAKRYAVLSLNNSKGKLHKALEEYAKITEYDTKFFNNFTYYDKEEINDKDFPRYYQREILKLLNAGSSTNEDNDILSYLLATENNENIPNINNESFIHFTKYYNYLTQYKSYFENNTQYTNTYITFVSDYKLINDIRKCIIEISQTRQKFVNDVVAAAGAAAAAPGVDAANAPTIATTTAINKYIEYFTTVTDKYEFSSYNNEIKVAIRKFAAAAADAARAAKVNTIIADADAADKVNDGAAAARVTNAADVNADAVDTDAGAAAGAAVDNAVRMADADYAKIDEYIRNIIIEYIKKIIQEAKNIESSIDNNKCIKLKINTNINDNMIKKINEIKKYYIPMLFKTIKPYIKKYSNNTFSSVYKSPTISYTVTPMNIRPLIDKRATETDLSNYAAQIASDSFLHSNKLPALPEVTTLNNISRLFEMVGGSTNINNNSNVYRTIFNSILNTLNSKKIRLNERDREKVDKSLDNLEQTEQYLKSTLSDYAKYASATKEKGKEISYAEVQKFVNNYENKLREYNQNSAHMLKFIGKLTRYLIIK